MIFAIFPGIQAPCPDAPEDVRLHPLRAVYKSRPPDLQCGTFDRIPCIITEHADILIQQGDILLQCGHGISFHRRLRRCPRFPEQNLLASSVPVVQHSADPVHEIHIQKSHQVKAESVYMVLFCPVEHRLQNIFCTHLPLAGHVISAGRTVGDPPVFKHPVEIPGRRALEPGVCCISMIIHHIHDHAEAVGMKRLYHFLHLADAHLSAGRIRGIGSFRNIVIHRVIAPVKLRVFPCFIYRAVIIGRHDLHMGDTQIFHIPEPGGMDPVAVQRRIRTGKCLIFPAVSFREAAGRIPGKFFHMELVDDLLPGPLRCPVIGPAFRIRPGKIHRHAALSVQPAGLRPRVGRAHFPPFDLQKKVIINPVQPLRRAPVPYAFLLFRHRDTEKRLSLAAVLIQIQGDPVCSGAPQFK